MRALIVLTFAITVASAGIVPRQSNQVPATFSIDGRITNGETAIQGQFPYQVALNITGVALADIIVSWFCGGVIITPTRILTAGHCVQGGLIFKVQLGNVVLAEPLVTYTVSLLSAIIHPGFSTYPVIRNDIAMLKIPNTQMNSNINIINLPVSFAGGFSNYTGQTAVATGWGLIQDTSTDVSSVLKYANLSVIGNGECALTYGNDITADKICTKTSNGTSTCSGDSGGGLVSLAEQVLIGITSFGAASGCQLGYPVVFTRITYHLDFINKHK